MSVGGADVRQVLAPSPEAADAFAAELARGAGCDPRVDRSIGAARDALRKTAGDEVEARRLVEQLAVTWTASLLVQHGDQDVADTYFRSRLDHNWASEFGTLPADAPLQRIANRAVPST